MGDIHWRASAPRARVDDYMAAQMGKLDQIHAIADEYECDYILAPGDVFDNATPPYWFVGNLLRRIGGHGGWMAVLGQHDQRYHSNDQANTPLGLLSEAGTVHILKPKPLRVVITLDHEIDVYGCSWGEDIPTIAKPGNCNILVMHRMVIGNAKLWRQQEEYMWSRHVLRRHEFDLIVTGDNHQFFTDSVPGLRWLINCGSLMRQNVDQVDHTPSVVVYDTDTRLVEVIPLKVAKAQRVLDLGRAKVEREQNAMLESFVEQVGGGKGAPDLDFLATLGKMVKSKGMSKGVAKQVDIIVEMSDGRASGSSKH